MYINVVLWYDVLTVQKLKVGSFFYCVLIRMEKNGGHRIQNQATT